MENEELVAAIQNGSNRQQNLERLYIQNKGFMLERARKYAAFADVEDLMQEAFFALENAADTFDSSRGVKFITHLYYHLKAVFLRFIGQCSGVSISARDFELITKYNRVSQLPDVEKCAALGVNGKQLETIKTMSAALECVSLNAPRDISNDSETTLQDLIPSAENIEEKCLDELAKQQAARELWGAVEKLGGKQAEIIKARYKDNLTRSKAAAAVGVDLNEARRSEHKALNRLRKMRELLELAEVYDCLIYRGTGLTAFRSRQMSSVEFVTLKKLELEERLKELD